MGERVLRESEVARITGLGRTTRYEMERRASFPRRRQLAPNAIGWLESEILEWLRSREVRVAKAAGGQ
jgi:prophage regulatory protein